MHSNYIEHIENKKTSYDKKSYDLPLDIQLFSPQLAKAQPCYSLLVIHMEYYENVIKSCRGLQQ